MTLQINLVSVPTFSSWRQANSQNFFSKTTWKKRGNNVSHLESDGLVVLEKARVRVPTWQPVLSFDGEFFTVATEPFEVYSENLVLRGERSLAKSSVESFSLDDILALDSPKSDFLSKNSSKSSPSSLVNNLIPESSSADSSTEIQKESESQKSPDHSISSLKKEREEKEGGGERREVGTIRSEGGTKSSQTSRKQKTSEVNNFVINHSDPRQRRNENHPCWIPAEYPIEQVPAELKDSFLKLSNLVYLYSQSQQNPDDFVSLKKRYLENSFGEKPARQILNLALQSRLLETDNLYEIGQKAKGYRFTETYRNQPHKIINTLRTKKDQANSDKVMNHRDNKHIRYLWEHLIRLTVNKTKLEAYRHVWQVYEPCVSILNGKFYLKPDDFGGRWYSNLTSLKKEARGLLRIEGKSESLWEIDIRNSQPLFASLAAQSKSFSDEKFSSLCQQGRLYEALMSSWGMPREDAKEELLRIFYSKNGYRSAQKKIFEDTFPVFSQFMEKSKAQNHTRFAHLMQLEERKFIVDTVVPELIRQSGGIFVATIHDSLLVERRRAEFAQDVLSGLFLGKYGVKPMSHLRDTGNYLKNF